MIRSTNRVLQGGRSKSNPQPQAPFRRPETDGGDVWVDPYRHAVRKELILCHYCGYSPSKIPVDGMCPKCGRSAWERTIVTRRLVPVSDED